MCSCDRNALGEKIGQAFFFALCARIIYSFVFAFFGPIERIRGYFIHLKFLHHQNSSGSARRKISLRDGDTKTPKYAHSSLAKTEKKH